MLLTHWVVENSINTLNWTPLRPVSALILCGGFWRGPEILMMINIACCECEMFVSLTRLSSTERIFADTSSIFMWSSSLCMSHAHLIFFKYFTVFLYFIVLLLVLVLVAIQAWRCPVGSLSAPIFLTHCLRGLKLITLHSVRTLDTLLLGFDTIALISLWLLGNLPSWTWVHEQNFGFSFS